MVVGFLAAAGRARNSMRPGALLGFHTTRTPRQGTQPCGNIARLSRTSRERAHLPPTPENSHSERLDESSAEPEALSIEPSKGVHGESSDTSAVTENSRTGFRLPALPGAQRPDARGRRRRSRIFSRMGSVASGVGTAFSDAYMSLATPRGRRVTTSSNRREIAAPGRGARAHLSGVDSLKPRKGYTAPLSPNALPPAGPSSSSDPPVAPQTTAESTPSAVAAFTTDSALPQDWWASWCRCLAGRP